MPKMPGQLTPQEIQDGLKNFYGTEFYHPISPLFPNTVMTDGVKWLCEQARCYWLMDIIASYQPRCQKDPTLKDIQFWTLKVENSKGIITCERDSNDVAFSQKIPYTDFPMEEIKIWVERGNYMVAMLPSER